MTISEEIPQPRILIVEDEAVIALDLKSILENLGYTVSGSESSADKAIKICEEDSPDLVLMDIVLEGEMDGIEAAEIVRSRWGIPVVFLTAFADLERLNRAKLVNPFGYLVKPFRDQDLKVTLEMAWYVARVDAERRKAEEALRRTKEEWETTFDSVPDLIAILNDRHRIVRVNKAMAERLGCTPEGCVGLTCYEVVHGSEAPPTSCPHTLTLADGGEHIVEVREDRLGGDFLISTAPIFDSQGKITGSVHVARDITAPKRAEEALKQNEEKYRFLAEKMADIVWTVDLNLRTTYVSPSIEKLLGFTPEERKKQTLEEMIPPESLRRVQARFMEELQREKDSLVDSNRSVTIELEYYHKDGTTLWMENTMKVMRDTQGAIVGIYGLSRDITVRKRAEEALRESEERFRTLSNMSHEGIIIHDQGVVLEANLAATRLLGYERPQEFIGKNIIEIHLTPEAQARIRQRLERQDTGPIEVATVRRDGSIFFSEIESYAIRYKGREVRIDYGRDITERKQAQEEREQLQAQLNQAQKIESVGRLAGGIAHDFNNMLGVILGHLELALEQLDPAQPLRSDLLEIQKAAQRSARLTKQLLGFARKQTIVPRVIDLNEAVEGLLNMMRRLLGEDIDLVWQPSSTLWPVKIDPSQIDQVLANLCVNARDAIEGIGRVIIETGNILLKELECAHNPGLAPGEYVTLTVSDNGCGMDRNAREHLFEPFFTTKDVGKGTGLGLATVYGIVKQNQGYVEVESEPGQGTRFKVYLPRHAGQVSDPREASTGGTPLGQGETILLVEDDSGILNIFRIMLERLGYKVLTAGNPGEALRLAGENTGGIHLLITDVIMPEINGRDLAGRLRLLCPELKVLFMSGYTTDVIAQNGVVDEEVHFMQKPFSMKALAEKVREALAGRHHS
jgi:two-component system, cell cycle sensor histidine kinase and response regulator CckA